MQRLGLYSSLLAAVITMLLFQNCSPFGVGTDGVHEDHRVLEAPGIFLNGPNGDLLAPAQSLNSNVDYLVRLGSNKFDTATVAWSLTANSANCLLTALSSQSERKMRCSAAGTVGISANASFSDGSVEQFNLSRTVVVPASPPPPAADPTIIVFNIPPGTAGSAWNSSATAPLVFVGQTLRIVNQDSMVHRLHSGGNGTCAHQPADMATGGMYDCRYTAARAATATGQYDHNVGTGAPFFVRVLDGAALYATSCQSCHGTLANSEVKMRSFAQIRAAITSNAGGVMGTIVRTDDELRAIAFSLSK